MTSEWDAARVDQMMAGAGEPVSPARYKDPAKTMVTDAVRVAMEFHETYERLAPEHNYSTRTRSAKPWQLVPSNNKSLMIATVQNLLDRGIIAFVKEAQPVVAPQSEEGVDSTRPREVDREGS